METDIREIVKRHSTPIYSWENCERRIENKDIDEIVDDIKWLFERELAKQEAKIFTYEAIIANSNFKAAIIRKKKEEE